MKVDLKSTNVLIVAMLGVAALAAAFWILALSPKRDEVTKLGKQVEQVESSLAQHRAEISQALAARKEFGSDYRQLVVLGKAVPGDDDTASLLVQLNQIADRAGVSFHDFELEAGSGEAEAAVPPAPASSTEAPVSATEVAASTMPLGASIGPAGLGVMPYTLTFQGNFFHVADFIKGLDSLVKTHNEAVLVNGRLLTIKGFSLEAGPNGFPELLATFEVTSYLTPPSQGVTAGASPTAAEPAATPASTTLGGTP